MSAERWTPRRYSRITYRADGRERIVFLRDPRVGPITTSGIEVDREGRTVGDLKISERLHVIANELILKRVPMRQSLTYGWLERETG